jgi:hypothetical protein
LRLCEIPDGSRMCHAMDRPRSGVRRLGVWPPIRVLLHKSVAIRRFCATKRGKREARVQSPQYRCSRNGSPYMW